MKYKNSLQKIEESLKAHKAEVDKLVVLYKGEKSAHEKEAANMKGTYTDEYIAQYQKNWTPKGNYAEAIKKSSDKALAEVSHYAGRIKAELGKYFDTMVRTDFVNRINAIASTGLVLRDKEFMLLAESATNYMELRMIAHLAESRTRLETTSKMTEHGTVETSEREVKIPYRIELPDIDRVYADYENFLSSARQFAKNYAGEGAELKGYLDAGTSDFAPINAMAYFRNHNADKFAETMEKANAVLPENKIKRELTEGDKKFIDTVINPDHAILAEMKVKEIVKTGTDNELVELLRLDERYSKFVEEVEGEE